jgi:hypothetical protein
LRFVLLMQITEAAGSWLGCCRWAGIERQVLV